MNKKTYFAVIYALIMAWAISYISVIMFIDPFPVAIGAREYSHKVVWGSLFLLLIVPSIAFLTYMIMKIEVWE